MEQDLNPYEWQYVCCGKMTFKHPGPTANMRFCTVCYNFWQDGKISSCSIPNWIEYARERYAEGYIAIHGK
jgi:hypothetical protein